MEIKRIQLRGISRAPSDRLTEDGGLSESLNMYLDTAESAPAFVPEDVTAKLGMPDDLIAERIFIHKTANYENFIAVTDTKVAAYTPDIKGDDEPLTVLELTDGEKVSDITSVGNTLIISTTKNIYYVLYRDMEYVFMGDSVPFPQISFSRTDIQEMGKAEASVSSSNTGGKFWFLQGSPQYIPSEEFWNKDGAEEHKSTEIKNCLDALWESINAQTAAAAKEGYLSSSVFLRYDIDLYGSKLSSMPILVPSTVAESLQAEITARKTFMQVGSDEYAYTVTYTNENVSTTTGLQKYKLFAQLSSEWDYSSWKGLIQSIRIYMSKPVEWGVLNSSTTLSARTTSFSTEGEDEIYDSKGTISFRPDPQYIDNLLWNSSSCFLVKEIPILNDNETEESDEFKSLLKGEVLDIAKFLDPAADNYVQLETQDRLEKDDMKHYVQTSTKVDSYNNRLLLVQPSQIIGYGYDHLNAVDIINKADPDQQLDAWVKYEVTYILKTTTEDKVVKGGPFIYKKLIDTGSVRECVYPFQIFPDARAYKMIVKREYYQDTLDDLVSTKYGVFDMLPHPYLDCAYYYGGMGQELYKLCTLDSAPEYAINTIDDLDNKLIVSEQDKPFVFPNEHRYTFQSKVLGVAVANTALSQGQFGQFPLYVFTEDGIWAMETAADGSFVTSKPLSREVCINPDSITSVDNAVVFVTDKGVMMISGSQVTNISPFMNGKHYLPSDSALGIIKSQEGYSELINAINDKEPFMSFVKSAKVAYDYAGQRLIFMSEGKDFQYVYKTDTQTWHKIAFEGFDLVQPLNSYPDCLVQGTKGEKTCVYDLSTVLDASRSQQTAKGVIITRPFDLDYPDVLKSITDVRVRGEFRRSAVKFILMGSNDGIHWATLGTLRGKSWKLFRIAILADLEPTERISWVDIGFETRFNNRLR